MFHAVGCELVAEIGDGMLATLRQQLAARLLAQVLQHVQLLVESFRSATDASFLDLATQFDDGYSRRPRPAQGIAQLR